MSDERVWRLDAPRQAVIGSSKQRYGIKRRLKVLCVRKALDPRAHNAVCHRNQETSDREELTVMKLTPTWLCVLEAGESAGPRRVPALPHVKICSSISKPGEEMAARYLRNGIYRPGDFVAVRHDLMPEDMTPGGRDNPFMMPAEEASLRSSKAALRQRLEASGYTVNQSLDVWSLYVIELDGAIVAKRQRAYKGYLYVGQTSQPVEQRIEQHRLGKNYPRKGRRHIHSRIAHKHFQRPRLDLIPDGFPKQLFCLEHALQAESMLRRRFEEIGYKVEGGTERYESICKV
jgi:hypothetical protein